MASVFNDRIAFIHVPKTGGTWAAEALRATFDDLQEPDDPDRRGHFRWNELPGDFRFGFVRQPATWYRSLWVHKITHEDWSDPPDLLDEIARDSKDFRDYVHTVTMEIPGLLSAMYEDLLGPPGAIQFIGRYENLVDDLIKALVMAGVASESDDFSIIRELAPANTGDSKVPITPAIRGLIAVSEHQAIERFGY